MKKENYIVPEVEVVTVSTEALVCASKTVTELDYEELGW